MKLAIGCDEAGFYLKEEVKKHLQGQGHEIEDVGVYNTDPAMYPDVAAAVAGKVLVNSMVSALRCATTAFPRSAPSRATMRRSCAWVRGSLETNWLNSLQVCGSATNTRTVRPRQKSTG